MINTSLFALAWTQNLAGGFPLLTFIVLLPIAGALVIATIPKEQERGIRLIGFSAAVLTLLCTLVMLVAFNRHDGNYQYVTQHEWIPTLGISWKFGVDGISLFLVVLTALIFPIALALQKIDHDVKGFFAWMLLLEAGCIGAFLALDLFMFFVCFEAVLVPTYFLIGAWGYADRNKAAVKFFLYTFAGSVFLLVGTLAYVILVAHGTNTPVTFDVVELQNHNDVLTVNQGRWIFLAFAVAFAVKTPIFPFHTWMPLSYEQSPVAAVVVSGAVMVKMGTYGLVRFGLELFPDASRDLAPLLLTLGVIGMIYGAIVAAAQKDLKRLAAYSSLSNLGFIILGTYAFTDQGLTGAVLQMTNHGLTAGAMFLLIGIIYARRGSSMISDLGGIQKVAPILAALFTVVMMSSIGVPGLNGFVGEFLILSGTFMTHRWWAVVGCVAVVLAAFYLLWAYQRTFHRQTNAETAKITDVTHRERWLIAPLIAGIVFIGVYPTPLLDRIEPSVERVLQSPITKPADAVPVTAPAASMIDPDVEGAP